MNVTAEEILEMFAEADALAGPVDRRVLRDMGPGAVRTRGRKPTPSERRDEKRRRRQYDRGLRRRRALSPQYVVEFRDQIVTLHLPPQLPERVRSCPCGGYLERRAGMAQLTHVGSRACALARGAA